MEVYSRKISPDEASKNYMFVLKDSLSFFPMSGRMFELHKGSSLKRVKVESYHCTCRGPEAPHEHYFIPWDGLKAGDMIFIKKDSKKATRYLLQVRSTEGQSGFCG